MSEFPATQIVHCPTGPVHTCDEHARALMGLMSFMGAHTVAEYYEGEAQCDNCVNENKNSPDVPQPERKSDE